MKALFDRLIKNKRILIISVIIIVVLIIISSFFIYSKKNSANGSWKSVDDERKAQLFVEGKDAVISVGSTTLTGKVNTQQKEITFHDPNGAFSDDLFKEKKKYPDYKVNYKIISKRLVITSDNFSATFTKQNDETTSKQMSNKTTASQNKTKHNKTENTSSETSSTESYDNEDEQYDLDPGDYTVGIDIEPGPYKVSMDYSDDDFDSENGSGSVQITDSKEKNKTYDFHSDDAGISNDIRIIFKDEENVTLKSTGKNTEFDLTADTDIDD